MKDDPETDAWFSGQLSLHKKEKQTKRHKGRCKVSFHSHDSLITFILLSVTMATSTISFPQQVCVVTHFHQKQFIL